MIKQVLKNSHFNIIEYIETRADGKQVITDSHFAIKGYYDPKSNKTTDSHFRIVGTGNLLTSLL